MMKLGRSKLLIPLVAAMLLCTACQGTPVKLPAVAEINTAEYDLDKGYPVFGEATGFQLLLFIPIGTNEVHQKAYADLVSRAAGAHVTGFKVVDSWVYAFVGTIYKTRIEATAYPRK